MTRGKSIIDIQVCRCPLFSFYGAVAVVCLLGAARKLTGLRTLVHTSRGIDDKKHASLQLVPFQPRTERETRQVQRLLLTQIQRFRKPLERAFISLQIHYDVLGADSRLKDAKEGIDSAEPCQPGT